MHGAMCLHELGKWDLLETYVVPRSHRGDDGGCA